MKGDVSSRSECPVVSGRGSQLLNKSVALSCSTLFGCNGRAAAVLFRVRGGRAYFKASIQTFLCYFLPSQSCPENANLSPSVGLLSPRLTGFFFLHPLLFTCPIISPLPDILTVFSRHFFKANGGHDGK